MFSRLFGRRDRAPLNACIPDGEAVYAIGDIHGRRDLMDQLLDQIAVDASRHPADKQRRIVFLGDYIDRGPESRGVLDALSAQDIPGFDCTFLLGNHEEAMLDFIDGQSDGTGWLSYGGLETLLSYGVAVRAMPAEAESEIELRETLKKAVPEKHLSFLRRCVVSYVAGDYAFVHAGVRPGMPLERQRREDLLWIRDDFLRSPLPLPGRVVVHGHTICDLPQNFDFRINIDTGAFVSGRLSCVALRGKTRDFFSTRGSEIENLRATAGAGPDGNDG